MEALIRFARIQSLLEAWKGLGLLRNLRDRNSLSLQPKKTEEIGVPIIKELGLYVGSHQGFVEGYSSSLRFTLMNYLFVICR